MNLLEYGLPNRPMLIAEIGGNHQGNFDKAQELTELAIESRVDVIKYQVYTGDTLVSPIADPERNQHFKKFELTLEQYEQLFKRVKDSGILVSASVWNKDALVALNEYIDIFKVGSGDFTYLHFYEEIFSYYKPVILSTGLCSMLEVNKVLSVLKDRFPSHFNNNKVGLLQCTSMYPIKNSDVNLDVMNVYKAAYPDTAIGYSDHTRGISAIEHAIILGSKIIEFHFTDNKYNTSFRDHQVSLDKEDVLLLHKRIDLALELQGSPCKEPLPIEKEANHHISFRRGIYASKNLPKGHLISEQDMLFLRPIYDIHALDYESIVGKRLKEELLSGHPFLSSQLI